jgi:hypothetical protein
LRFKLAKKKANYHEPAGLLRYPSLLSASGKGIAGTLEQPSMGRFAFSHPWEKRPVNALTEGLRIDGYLSKPNDS